MNYIVETLRHHSDRDHCNIVDMVFLQKTALMYLAVGIDCPSAMHKADRISYGLS